MKSPMAINRMATRPVSVPRSRRIHTARSLTSLPAGKMVPITAIPLLREDSIRSGRLRFSFEMMETAEILMNAVHVDVKAYLVPMLALERFNGSMDILNRSWEGVPPLEGEDVIPYIETEAFGDYGANDVYVYLGLHGRKTQLVNTAYLEAYNQIWNFRAKNRSPDLTLRTRLQKNLAPAFWNHEMFRHIVPDFDQALVDGEIALDVINQRLQVKGIALQNDAAMSTAALKQAYRESGGATGTSDGTNKWSYVASSSTENGTPMLKEDPARPGFPDVWAELEGAGVAISLSNLELAKKTAAFARLRQSYSGHSDEWLINMLMDGLTVPEQAFKQPMLVGQQSTIFGMSKRYASDSGNLTESVVNGATFVDLSIQLPRIPTGGVVMVVAEVTPEQLFERQKDAFLHAKEVDALPHYLRDTLDPEKVSAVPCDYVDLDHETPDATFGYAPLNYEWNVTAPRIGGRFYRPQVDAGFDEDRQRLWAVETKNPKLSEDFYLCTEIHTKPFVVTDQDPFEVVTQGDFLIEGNTVFGAALVEANGDYDAVLEKAPTEKIVKPVEGE